jgi:hypothetical protein
MPSPKTHNTFRKLHRWLGFFLAGIMAVYASSGILLIFRSTDALKSEQTEQRQLAQSLDGQALGEALRLRNFKVLEQNENEIIFNQGSYNPSTGQTLIVSQDYIPVVKQMLKLHKANTNSPLFWLNISFGVSLLFFVISAFLMFLPKTALFKNGLKIAGAGFAFAILMVIFGS